MKYIYGTFTDDQIIINAKFMHNEIHKLLLYKDKNFKEKIFDSDDDFYNFYTNLLYRFGGLNKLLNEPDYMVSLMSTLQAALDNVKGESYDYKTFRRLILDAHGYIKLMFEEV